MTPSERLLQLMEKEHAATMRKLTQGLLKGIPTKGGHFSREILREMIKTAFIEGVMAQRFKHAEAGKN